jgi:sec-independent protein translocase protein TatA
MFGLGLSEMLLVCLILVLIFGASRLPELGRGVGESIRNFKGSIRDEAVDQDETR